MSEFNDLVRDITNVYLAGMGLPPLKASGQAIGSETTLAASLDRTDASHPLAPVDLRGTELWERLRKRSNGPCSECGHDTENFDVDNDDWCCDDCRAEIVRGQEEDHRLDSPRHGQARDINAKFWDVP